ncbi:MAG: hypothetical protein FJ167_01445 [Gammaproteobacteria bacterium]|nr:hypothetical protein [Gammaproteobacteria bacterium]MBM4210123.1 hypothetical protein [Gammaproteobacteria bacterium]MBM4223465.1 hypothetical protein [Gammaproteobacteria bacterium]MBM4230524.1 hypothetical protein [Gammaproteobacteria bacterium]
MSCVAIAMRWPALLQVKPGVTDRERQLAARRTELLARSAALRDDIGARSREMLHGWQGAERLVASARAIANRPVLIAGAAALVLLLGPRRALPCRPRPRGSRLD